MFSTVKKPAQNPELPPPPRRLGRAGRAYWEGVVAAFVVENWRLPTLEAAARQLDRANRAARRANDKTLSDSARERAECGERSAQLAFARLQRELCLDVSPPSAQKPRLAGGRF